MAKLDATESDPPHASARREQYISDACIARFYPIFTFPFLLRPGHNMQSETHTIEKVLFSASNPHCEVDAYETRTPLGATCYHSRAVMTCCGSFEYAKKFHDNCRRCQNIHVM